MPIRWALVVRLGDGVLVAVPDGVAVALGVGVLLTVPLGVPEGVLEGVAVTVGDGDGLRVAEGVALVVPLGVGLTLSVVLGEAEGVPEVVALGVPESVLDMLGVCEGVGVLLSLLLTQRHDSKIAPPQIFNPGTGHHPPPFLDSSPNAPFTPTHTNPASGTPMRQGAFGGYLICTCGCHSFPWLQANAASQPP